MTIQFKKAEWQEAGPSPDTGKRVYVTVKEQPTEEMLEAEREENRKKGREFIKELTLLTEKHGVSIAGCGCHGSPYLELVGKHGFYSYEHGSDGAPELISWQEKEES